MVKTASLRLDNMPRSKAKETIEGILDYEDERFLESDDGPYKDIYEPKNKNKRDYRKKQ